MLRRAIRRLGGHGHGHQKEQKVFQQHPDDEAFHRVNRLRQQAELDAPGGYTSHNAACRSALLGFVALCICYKYMFEWTLPKKRQQPVHHGDDNHHGSKESHH